MTLKNVTDVHQGAGEGSFTITADWLAAAPPDKPGAPIITETRTMTFRAPSADTRIIDIDLRLRARTTVTFADHHDALLGLRLAKPFEIAQGGRVKNAEGLTQWDRVRGARAPKPTRHILRPIAGITNVDPARQIQFALRARF